MSTKVIIFRYIVCAKCPQVKVLKVPAKANNEVMLKYEIYTIRSAKLRLS